MLRPACLSVSGDAGASGTPDASRSITGRDGRFMGSISAARAYAIVSSEPERRARIERLSSLALWARTENRNQILAGARARTSTTQPLSTTLAHDDQYRQGGDERDRTEDAGQTTGLSLPVLDELVPAEFVGDDESSLCHDRLARARRGGTVDTSAIRPRPHEQLGS